MKRVLCAAMIWAATTSAMAQTPAAVPSPSVALSAPVQVSARLERPSVALGETALLTADVTWVQGTDVQPPAADALDFAPLEVRDAVMTPLPVSNGRKGVRYTVRLAGYEPGKVTVRGLEIAYKTADDQKKSVSAAPLELTIERAASVPAPSPAAASATGAAPARPAEIRDLKPLQDVSMPVWVWAALAAGGLLAVLGVVALSRKLLRRSRQGRPVVTTPHGLALSAIDRLVAENLPTQGRLKEHYDRLAVILRTYLSQRFALPVLEHTTSEVVAMMRAASFDEALRADVRLVLDEADLVKFARLQVPTDKAFAQAHAVRTIVERTIPAPVQAVDAKPSSEASTMQPVATPASRTAGSSAPGSAAGREA